LCPANDIRADFERYGNIVDIWIAKKPPGFAFVEYDASVAASDAVQDMDDRYFMSKKIKVEVSRRGLAGGRIGNSQTGDARSSRNDHADASGDGKQARNPAPARTDFRVRFSGLASGVSSFLRYFLEPQPSLSYYVLILLINVVLIATISIHIINFILDSFEFLSVIDIILH
jgi:RNA recognition motif-containing protein